MMAEAAGTLAAAAAAAAAGAAAGAAAAATSATAAAVNPCADVKLEWGRKGKRKPAPVPPWTARVSARATACPRGTRARARCTRCRQHPPARAHRDARRASSMCAQITRRRTS